MDPERKKEIRREYLLKGSMVFLLIAACVIFAFCVFQYGIVWRHVSRIINVFKPIFFGLIIAYVINPIVNFFDKYVQKLFGDRLVKRFRSTEKVIHVISVILSLLLFLLIIALCFYLIIPEFVSCISDLAAKLPQQIHDASDKMIKTVRSDSGLRNITNDAVKIAEEWMEKSLVPRLTNWVTEFSWASDVANGIGAVVGFFKNFVIGLICALYLLLQKSLFLQQFKKMIYAVFKNKTADSIVNVSRKTHSIFNGFINGKLLDSLIIGILCFIGVTVLKIPYTMLVSVIVGITNIIPVFGPYLGGIPCFILILLANPVKGITFGVFVILLQMLDGNFIGPKILGDKTGLETFWVVFAITVGGGLFGVFGMLIGVPVFAVCYYLFGRLINHLLRRKNMPTESSYYGESTADVIPPESTPPEADAAPAEKKEESE